ncbi:Sortilin-related receptor [Thelohanellus kitauei]|uniref:Sortilin-related receptor n=1 Tax=Thelohanellus kitauei TaxID=669202 RepID=A0A0C2ILL0_THEKT|nr:Sortilin-related receptor [Thelohanellus kitauei]
METRTYVSFDNMKNFKPLVLEGQSSASLKYDSWIEMDLQCSIDTREHNFQDYWIVNFQGTYHRKHSSRKHTFISFNGGKSWKIIGTQIENLIILGHGGLLFGSEKGSDKIFFSYNEGNTWHSKFLKYKSVIVMKKLEYPNNLAIATINYNTRSNIYYFYLFKFSSVLSNRSLMTDTMCQRKDFQTWYVPRYFRNCFQGQQVFYMKKKSNVLCVDNRTFIRAEINQCPCFIEDFQWY